MHANRGTYSNNKNQPQTHTYRHTTYIINTNIHTGDHTYMQADTHTESDSNTENGSQTYGHADNTTEIRANRDQTGSHTNMHTSQTYRQTQKGR